MERIAVIDLGSNSFHMIICEVGDKYFNHIKIANDNDYKAYVHLGKNLKKGEMINKEKIDEILSVLTRFYHVAQSHKVDHIFCIATEALRRAANGKEIIELIKEQIGMEVELISGEKEAFLGFYGIVNSFALNNYLMVDIGGSSTELVYVNNRHLKNSISLPIGSLNICDLFDSTDQIDDTLLHDMTESISGFLRDVDWLKDVQIDAVIGVGGTMRTIGKYERAKLRYPLSIPHNYPLTIERVKDIFYDLRLLSVEERLHVPELPSKRAVIFPSALILVLTVMNYVQNKQLIISKYGLREGVVFDYLLNGEISENVLERDIEKILDEYHLSKSLYKEYSSKALKSFKSIYGNECKQNKNLIQLSTVFQLKKLTNDGKQTKKFLKYVLSRGVYGATHQQILIALMAVDFPFDNKYKKVLTEDDLEQVSKMKEANLFGE